MSERFLNLGDSALTLELGDRIDRDIAARVAAIDHRLRHEQAAGTMVGVVETIPTYRSLTVIFDPLVLPRAVLKARLTSLTEKADGASDRDVRFWRLPVCYDEEYGPDLLAVARSKELTPAEVIRLHSGRDYTVYMIGFLPGFPYMGDLEPALEMPRRKEPRVRVPVGAVGITGLQTAIYPWVSPGGWQLLGRCPVPLFDACRPEPALLAQGDRVRFEPVSVEGFQVLEMAAKDGSLDLTRFQVQEGATPCPG
jgi:KipI family sensor histidine kinase inhibitor